MLETMIASRFPGVLVVMQSEVDIDSGDDTNEEVVIEINVDKLPRGKYAEIGIDAVATRSKSTDMMCRVLLLRGAGARRGLEVFEVIGINRAAICGMQ